MHFKPQNDTKHWSIFEHLQKLYVSTSANCNIDLAETVQRRFGGTFKGIVTYVIITYKLSWHSAPVSKC